MADTNALRPYRRGTPPTVPGGDTAYLDGELAKIGECINAVISVLKKLEARLVAAGL